MSAEVHKIPRRQLAAYVLPFLAFMLLLALSGKVSQFASDLLESSSVWLSQAEYWVYPLQCLVCGGLMIYFWRDYDFGKGRLMLPLSLATGLVVLGIWIAPQWIFGADPRYYGFDPTYFEDSPGMYYGQVGLRFLRLVVIVPFLEEIFWRGFLMRFLINEKFTEVQIGAFSWKSFVGVAVLFAVAHAGPDFTVALITGFAYNGLAVITRNIWSCVIAHALTNLLLGIYIMKTGQWGFW